MFTGILLIFDTVRTWERIILKPRSWQFVLLAHLLPLLLMTSFLEGYSLVQWGKPQGEIHQIRKFGLTETVSFETAQLVLTLGMILFSAKLVQSLSETFHGRHTFAQAFILLAYSLSPLIILRAFNAIPTLSPWIPWGIGIILFISALYHGLPGIMQPDPPHAFGLFLTSAMLVIIASGLLRFVISLYLEGKLERLQRLFTFA